LLRDRRHRRTLRVQRVDGFIACDPRGMPLLLLRREALLAGLSTLAFAASPSV
jgi:hypothetical protein